MPVSTQQSQSNQFFRRAFLVVLTVSATFVGCTDSNVQSSEPRQVRQTAQLALALESEEASEAVIKLHDFPIMRSEIVEPDSLPFALAVSESASGDVTNKIGCSTQPLFSSVTLDYEFRNRPMGIADFSRILEGCLASLLLLLPFVAEASDKSAKRAHGSSATNPTC
ncbi:MAG: hypothetical protein U0930_07275 [Pirellulales bacterium]